MHMVIFIWRKPKKTSIGFMVLFLLVDCCLYKTGVKLELVTDCEMYDFILSGKRGVININVM